MKLDNKGFAFSTMLYGTLALITIILYLILGIAKGSSDETYFYGDEIQIKLNECVAEEVALENCYSSHSGSCSPTSYHACLGISDSPTEVQGDLIAETLKAKAEVEGSGIVADELVPRRYVYRGSDANNYLKYSNKIWRIVSIEPDGSLKLLDYAYVRIVNWDINGEDNWPTSTLKVFLNGNYLTTIVDVSQIVSGMWKSTIVRPSGSTEGVSMTELNEAYQQQQDDVTSYSQVGILSIGDYANAASKDACRDHILTETGCYSWLSQYKGWTLNINGDSEGNSAFYMDTSGALVDGLVTSAQKVYPVVILDRNNVILMGNGTVDDPYILK